MKKILVLFLFLFHTWVYCQVEYKPLTPYFLFNVGYTYQSNHYLNAGIDSYWVRPNNDILNIGMGADVGKHIIPKAYVGYLFNIKGADLYSENFNAPFWLVRTQFSPYHIQPEVGVTLLSIVEFSVGYGFSFQKQDIYQLKGIKIGANVRLPFLLFWHD